MPSLVALQPDQLGAQHRRQRLSERGLTQARLALTEQRAVHREREERRRREAVVGEIAGGAQGGGERCRGTGGAVVHPPSMTAPERACQGGPDYTPLIGHDSAPPNGVTHSGTLPDW